MEHKDIIVKQMKSIISEFKDKTESTERAEILAFAWQLIHLKGFNLTVLDLREVESFTNYLIIVNATSTRHTKSLAEDVCEVSKVFNHPCYSKEGIDGGEWILLDFSNFIIHIFTETSRNLYNIEELWQKGVQVKIPQEFYENQLKLSSEHSQSTSLSEEDPEDYF